MTEIISLLISLIPNKLEAIKYLKLVPGAVTLVKKLVAEVQEIVALAKQPRIPKTAEQRKVLDDAIAAISDDPYFAEEPAPGIPPK